MLTLYSTGNFFNSDVLFSAIKFMVDNTVQTTNTSIWFFSQQQNKQLGALQT